MHAFYTLMNNLIICERILQSKYLSSSQLHPSTFSITKAGRRFKGLKTLFPHFHTHPPIHSWYNMD